MAKQNPMTDLEIRAVFKELKLGGSSQVVPFTPTMQPVGPPVYFPLSADSLDANSAK